MPQINSIDEANQALAAFVPITKELTGRDITVDRMRLLMAHVGKPEKKLKIIHLAGTSGKTSTAYYMASLLQQSGQKVGLTVSPHMDSVTERVQINLQPVDDTEFCRALTDFLKITEDFSPKPSYFELIIAFAFWYFARQNIDYVVLETGVGGLHDATNIAGRKDKVCIITDIGYDHMHLLGNTLKEIAAQKAGIIHPGNHVYMYDQTEEINRVVKQYASKQQAPVTLLDEVAERQKSADTVSFAALPMYQQRNWLLARGAYEFIAKRDGLSELDHEALQSSLRIQIPGRMDITHVNGSIVVMDGAHNEPKMRAFVESFQVKFPDQKAAVLLSLKEGKEFQEVLPLLEPVTSCLILTTFTQGQDLPSVPIDPHILAAEARKTGFTKVYVQPDQKKAYRKLLDEPGELKIITGSFYLLSQLRHIQ